MPLQYVIDGYNIINHPLFNPVDRNSQDPGLRLLGFITSKRLTGSNKNKITIVLDGYPGPNSSALCGGNADIVYSRKISADEKIKRIIEEHSGRKNIIVVSDDKEIKFAVRLLGARHQGVGDFIGSKEKKASRHKEKESPKHELNYTQIHTINEELREKWLK